MKKLLCILLAITFIGCSDSSENEDLLSSVNVDFKHLRKGNTNNPNLSN